MNGYLYLYVFTELAVHINCLLPCLTWEMKDGFLSLTCQLMDFSSPVYFVDNRGKKRGLCSFHTPCDNIKANDVTNKVTIKIKLEAKDIHLINGEWSCVHANKTYTSFVKTLTGYVKVSNLAINGVRHGTSPAKKINITCSSCQKPHSNGVEFLVNGKTVDAVKYYPKSDMCTNKDGDCSPSDTCSCSFQGHQFSRLFADDAYGNNLSISCVAIFKEDSGYLHRISTIQFDANGFTQLGSNDTFVPVSDHPKDHNTSIQIVSISSVIVVTVIIAIVIIQGRQLTKKKSYEGLPVDEKKQNDLSKFTSTGDLQHQDNINIEDLSKFTSTGDLQQQDNINIEDV